MIMTSNIYKWYLIGLSFVIFHLSFSPARAQFNTDRLINVGRSALYYEDYVLSIQYFNQAISAKPYLYEPWFYRGVAKFYLDDFGGAEADCTEAIRINPYITGIYELRGLCRIRQKKYSDAITDYDKALQYDPSNQGFWYNRVLCRIQDKDFEGAHHDLDSMTVRWKKYAPAFSLKADVFIQQGDTLKGAEWLDKSLEIDPYNGDAWTVRAAISLSRRQWRDAEQQLGKAIHLKPKVVGNYINRALARYYINKTTTKPSTSILTTSSATTTVHSSVCRWATTTVPSSILTTFCSTSPTTSWPASTAPCCATARATCAEPSTTIRASSICIPTSGPGCTTARAAIAVSV